MKKILILVGAIATAVACNAAAVSWQSGAVYNTSASAKVGKGNTDYLVSLYFFTDAAGTTAVTGLTGDTSLGKSGTGSKYSGTVEGFSAGTKYYVQLVVTTDGYEAKSDIASFTTQGTGDTTIDFSDGTGFSPSYTFSTQTPGAWQAAAVPEPTSGLLMLLGLAGLALKRKRA